MLAMTVASLVSDFSVSWTASSQLDAKRPEDEREAFQA
jgi:hypothetical protein